MNRDVVLSSTVLSNTVLSSAQLDRARAVASLLVPGSAQSPAPDAIADFDDLLQRAAVAMGTRGEALAMAIDVLPAELSWESLSGFADDEPARFELVSTLCVGAYFMSPEVLVSLGRPTEGRRAANREQVVDELSDGLLDPVLERGSPIRTLDDINGPTT